MLIRTPRLTASSMQALPIASAVATLIWFCSIITFVASPRTAILPPLARVPGSVAGRTYVVKFWVAADGRVTRVEIDPPMADAAYSREFQQRMMAYQFYPARTRDGQNVASIVLVPLRIGN